MTRVGVIGAGQLGQMLGYAGRKLGVEFIFLDPSDDPPAASAGEVLKYAYDDAEGLEKLARAADVITYEFENVPVDALTHLPDSVPVFPPAAALAQAQDRLAEKTLFTSLDIPVPGYRTIDSPADLGEACDELGLPVVLKTRRLGYDGKGQAIVRDKSALDDVVESLGGANLIAEQWVAFDKEVSAIGARTASGDIVFYPLTENRHANGILSASRAPVDDGPLTELANTFLERLLMHLDYVGVLALELFVVGDRLLANEYAPRVHNSGHWTIEGAETSQFENHVRAILDMPPGNTRVTGAAGMLNLIGQIPADREALDTPPAHLHDYGKAPRPGRKLGHVTVVTDAPESRDSAMRMLAKSLNL